VNTCSLLHLSDQTLSHDLAARMGRERIATAEVLPYLAEFDARRLFVPAGYPSMFAYCLGEFGLSEDAAFKRIRVARTARQFPVIFSALAEGRLHMTAVVMLTPYLRPENADELLAAATGKRKSEIEQLLARQFPRPDLPAQIRALAPVVSCTVQLAPEPVASIAVQLAPEPVEAPGAPLAPEPVASHAGQLAPEPVESPTPVRGETPGPRPRVTPLAPRRFGLQVTIDQSTHDDLRHAQALLGHQVPSGNVAEVLARALRLFVRHLEKRKFAATSQPRPSQRRSNEGSRHIPAEVRRAVWNRDGGRCTFVSASGVRCEARKLVEFDHIHEFARGGQATLGGIRLLCRPHNQYGAERTYGVEFMRRKREAG